jgi:hypothetical protein
MCPNLLGTEFSLQMLRASCESHHELQLFYDAGTCMQGVVAPVGDSSNELKSTALRALHEAAASTEGQEGTYVTTPQELVNALRARVQLIEITEHLDLTVLHNGTVRDGFELAALFNVSRHTWSIRVCTSSPSSTVQQRYDNHFFKQAGGCSHHSCNCTLHTCHVFSRIQGTHTAPNLRRHLVTTAYRCESMIGKYALCLNIQRAHPF